MDAMDAIMERKEERPFIATDDELEEDLRMSKYRESGLTTIVLRQSMLWARCSLQKVPMKMNVTSIGAVVVFLAVLLPKPLTYMLLYPLFRLVFGTLYPAYASYKAVRTQNVKEYVKWMMYWIVFALFTCAETFTDVFFSFWFPFYYEIKIILVLWLLSPATKGSSILYRRFVHPALTRREAEIDEALARATEQGYKAVLHLGTRGVNYATTVLMQTAIKNLTSVLPIAANALPSSESDTAISSLASRPQTPTGQQPQTQQRSNEAPSSARDDQSKKEDSSDGVATTTVSNRKRRSKSKNVSVDYPMDLELRQVSTDEDTAVADAPLHDLPVELLVKKMMEEGRVFKAPPEKTRRSRKERNAESTRKQKSRSCKESAKNYAADFSEDADLS